MNAKEVEFKYNAESLSLSKFTAFCKKRQDIKKFVLASGWDHFYDDVRYPDSFWRHRIGPDMNQLTMKRKTTTANNYVRTEHNVDLGVNMTQDQIQAVLKDMGCEYNTSLFKSCFVYVYQFYTLVYYVCYDTEMKECGRFVEIEMAEDGNWRDENEAFSELLVMEKICKELGANPNSRIAPSLYEMFRKNNHE